MGRPRKNPEQGLSKRMTLKSGSFYYIHAPDVGGKQRWEKLGQDLAAARVVADSYNGGTSMRGTIAWWLEEWIVHMTDRVAKGHTMPRTLQDYKKAVPLLKDFFGGMLPSAVTAPHVAEYLTIGLAEERAVQANREKSAFSSCMSWMVLQRGSGITGNVCLQVPRNPETGRDRYVSDAEYNAVYAVASAPVRAWMELMFRTLQRPADILKWTKHNLIEEDGRKVLCFRQSKTGARIKILVTDTLQRCFDEMAAVRAAQKRPVSSVYLICTRDGQPYTEMGISSMARRHIADCKILDFAPYDCKAKGATDMFQAGTPIAEISALCAHESITTTEKYIKRHLVKVISPNDRETRQAGEAA